MASAYRILEQAYGQELAIAVFEAYVAIEENYSLGKWKASELDAGHFVEAVRRILEQQLYGTYTPLSGKLARFSDATLKKYEQASGDESYRILIPRALKAIYNVRNKRGVGHLNSFSANEMDATYILYSVKWVLAELIRLGSQLTVQETQLLVDEVVERQYTLVWKSDDIIRILDTKLVAREKVLVLLYDESPRSEESLRSIIEYRNTTGFRAILRELHRKRLIEYKDDKNCVISPAGLLEAESIIRRSRHKIR